MPLFPRKHPSWPRLRLRGLAAGSLCVLMMTTTLTPADAAQVDIIDYEIDDGSFTGTVALNGNFVIDVSKFDPRAGGEMVVWIDVAGPASMDVKDGAVTGDWSFAGDGGLNGAFSAPGYEGFEVTLLGETTYNATGTFVGNSDQARLIGTLNSTGTAEVIVPGPASAFNPGPQSSSSSDPLDEVLTDVLAGCRQVVARFERRLTADVEAQIPGAVVNAQGIVALYDGVTDDEQKDELESIVEMAADLDTSSGDPLFDLTLAVPLLRRVQQLQDELAQNSDCPPSKEFFNALTQVATRLGDRALEFVEDLYSYEPDLADETVATVLPLIVELLVATGADGAGAADSAETLGQAEEIGHEAWKDLLLDETLNKTAILNLSSLAVQMGWEFTNGHVDAQDVVFTLGG